MTTIDELKVLARARYEEGVSLAEIGAEVGRSDATIHNWAKKGEWRRPDGWKDGMAAAREVSHARMGQRWLEKKGKVVDELTDDLLKLHEQLFAPTVRKEVKVVGQGNGVQEVEIVEVEQSQPSTADQKNLVVAMAVLVDKLQLLTGEATSRTETGPIADREQAEAMVKKVRDELEERRAGRAAAAGGA